MDFHELRLFPIFKDFSDAELESFAGAVEKLEVGADAMLFDDGDPGDCMYLLGHGEVKVHKMLGRGEDRTDKTLAVLPCGECFGEMAIIDHAPRSAAVSTTRDCILYKVSRREVERLIAEEPAVANRFISYFLFTANERLRATNNELVALYEVGKIIGDPGNVAALVSRVLAVVMQSIRPDRGFVILDNDIAGVLEVVEAQGETAQKFLGKKYKPGAGIVGGAIALKQPRRYDNLPALDKKPPLAGFEGAAVMVAPLFFQHKSFGAMIVCSDTPESFSNANYNLLQGVASQAGSAIQNARTQMDNRAKERLQRKMYRF